MHTMYCIILHICHTSLFGGVCSQDTYDIEVLDGDREVGVLLGASDHRRGQHVPCTLDVDTRLVDGRELDPLEIAHPPEQDLWWAQEAEGRVLVGAFYCGNHIRRL